MQLDDKISETRRILRDARRVTVLTGAGISAESGVPTFRGGGGTVTWKGHPATTLSSSELLSANPKLVWEWFEYRRQIIKPLQPNPAHRILADWQQRFDKFRLITQNVDGLHQKAGSENFVELHGNLWRGRGVKSGRVFQLFDTPLPELPPRGLGSELLRPDVVLFGERLPEGAFERASRAAESCDVFFVIGTSAVVYPAASLPEIAGERGIPIIEINPEATELSPHVTFHLAGKAGEILPLLA